VKPFHNLQIVEIAGSPAGAFAAKLFADYGAEVIKVEPPDGDELRTSGEPWGEIGSEFAFFNTSKRSICIDVNSSDGLNELARLLEFADVMIESSAPDPHTPLPSSICGDRLIRVSISPFGLSGPYAGYRSNVFTDDAIGGHMYLSGEPDREPIPRAGSHTLLQAGTHAFIGCMAALLAREREHDPRFRLGQNIEISHFEGMVALHQHTSVMWTHGGHIVRREGNKQPGIWHPSGVYPCKDGYIFLGMSGDKKLIPFVQVLGYEHLFDDPRFADMQSRASHKQEFDDALIPRLMELTAAEITDLGRAVFAPIGPVPELLEVLDDEQLEDRNFWESLEGQPPLRIPRGPFLIDGHVPKPEMPPLEPSNDGIENIIERWAKTPDDAISTAPLRWLGLQTADLDDGPLQGLRVLDLTRVWAGPIAGRILGDLGADVISIEAPWNRGPRGIDADYAAMQHLYPENDSGERHWNRNSGFNKLARNKRGITLDLQDERGREILAALVKHADVVLENYSPRVMPQLGFDFDSLKDMNSHIVYTSMPGYGSSGPGQNRVALGPVIEAAAGLTSMMGYADSGPYRSGVAWADPVSGLAAVAGTLVAFWNRQHSGKAQHVETAMSESMATFTGDELLAAQVRGSNPPRMGNRHAKFAPQGVYPCIGNDRWVAISCTNDTEWQSLCEVANLSPELLTLDESDRRARHDEIDLAISAWTRGQSPKNAMNTLQSRSVLAVQVSDARDLLEDPQLERRAFWAELNHPDVGLRLYPGNPIRLSRTPITYRVAAPGLGEHNDEVFAGLLDMSEEDLEELRRASVIVETPPEIPEE